MTTQSNAQEPPILLADGSPFPLWRDETVYRKVYCMEETERVDEFI